MYWRNLTSKEFEGIDRTTPVILPIGAVEQHGPHLNVETDVLIAEYFCDKLNTEISDDVLILPSIAVCASAHHMDFAGSLTVSHETLIRYIKEVLGSVLANGFQNIIIFNGHGGRLHLKSYLK